MSSAPYRLCRNEAVTGPGSAGSFGFPSQAVGSAMLGNVAFSIGLSGAAPGAPAALGLSLAPGAYGAPPAAIWLDLSPGQLLLPDLATGLGTFVTDASGLATFSLPIPNDPAVQGASFYTQWAIADPLGPFTINGIPFALSEARKIVAW